MAEATTASPSIEEVHELEGRAGEIRGRLEEIRLRLVEIGNSLAELQAEGLESAEEGEALREERRALQNEADELEAPRPPSWHLVSPRIVRKPVGRRRRVDLLTSPRSIGP